MVDPKCDDGGVIKNVWFVKHILIYIESKSDFGVLNAPVKLL